MRLAESVFPPTEFEIEEVLAILNDVLERVQRHVPQVIRLKVKPLLPELLDQLAEVNSIPEYARVRHDHEAAGPVQLLLELPLPILASTREEDVASQVVEVLDSI